MNDLQDVFLAFLKVQSSPFTACDLVKGYPNRILGAKLEKVIVYVLAPVIVNSRRFMQHGGGKSRKQWSMTIGIWNNKATGGKQENLIIASELSNIVCDDPTIYTDTFNVTLGSTTYTGKTLKDFEIVLDDIQGPDEIVTEDPDETRNEIIITFTA